MMSLTKYKLGELLDIKRGAGLSGKFYSTEGEYIRLTCGNFDYENNCFKENLSKDDIYFTGKVKPEFIMKKGDIITPLTEQAIGLLGSTAMIPEDNKYIQSQDVAKVICNEELLYPGYAYYLLSSKLVKQQLAAGAQQTKIRHTSPEKIKDCTVWVPSLEEQKRIADALLAIDGKITLNETLINNLSSICKKLYDYWFIQYDFPNAEGKPYKASGGQVHYDNTLKMEIPDGWSVGRLDDLLDNSGVSISPKKASNYTFYTPLDRIPQRKMSFSTFAPIEEALSSLQTYRKKEIILGSMRVYFHKVCIAPFDGITRTTAIVMHPKIEKSLGYCYEVVNEDSFIQYATQVSNGSQQPMVSWTVLSGKEQLLPPIELIQKYSKNVEGMIDSIITFENEIIEMKKLKEKLLPLMMNGQINVKA